MATDRPDGTAKKVTGSIKEAIGKVTGDAKLQAEGAVEKVADTAQDTVRGAVKK